MKRVALVAIILLAAFGAEGCALVRFVRFARGKKELTINVADVVYCGAQPDGLHFDVGLQFRNLSSGEARVRRLSLAVQLGNRDVFRAERAESLVIPPAGSIDVRVPVVIDPVAAAIAVADGGRRLVLVGEATLDLGIVGTFTFRSDDKLFTRGHGIHLTGVSLAKSTLSRLCITLRFQREHPEDDPLKSMRLTGNLLVNGREVAGVDFAQPKDPAEKLEVEVVASSLATVALIGRLVAREPLDVKVDVLFEAETGTLKYRVPYVFEKKGLRFQRDGN